MELYKQQIVDKGYNVVAETEYGISFVNEDVHFCVILLKQYLDDYSNDKEEEIYGGGFNLHKTLTSKYEYANKSTICIIINSNVEKEKVCRDSYHYNKIFIDKINILPTKPNKNIKITFSPMVDSNDIGDYTINPFDKFDGLCCTNFIDFIANVKENSIVKYPKIIETSYFRYHTHKLYDIELI